MLGKRDFQLWRNLLCVFTVLHCPGAYGTSVLTPSFAMLVDRAELIFTGQVASQRCEWRSQNGQNSIVTLVTLAVEQVHKGHAGPSITLQILGGTIGNVSLDVAETPKFKTGERLVLFVEGNGLNASPIVGFFHGKFSLQRDKAGREAVFKHDGQPFLASNTSATKQALTVGKEPITHDEFATQIRRRVASGAK